MAQLWIVLVAVIATLEARSTDTGFHRRSDDDGWRIIGGGTAVKGSYPWQVSLAVREPFGSRVKHICGGSIIDSQWVLTARHCVQEHPDPSVFVVTVGEHDLKKEDGTEQRFNVLKVIKHEKFNPRTYVNDVTLLKLDRPINLNDDAAKIPLATPDQDKAMTGKEECVTSGWGELTFQGHVPNLLQEVAMPLVPQQDCKDAYKLVNMVTNEMLCAGYMLGGKGICQGDSGGPLVCKIDGKFTQVGVTSWGVGCGERRHPGVFVRIASFNDWIQQKIKTTL